MASKLDMVDLEIDILSRLHHPNIIQLDDIFETDENFYLVLELYAFMFMKYDSIVI